MTETEEHAILESIDDALSVRGNGCSRCDLVLASATKRRACLHQTSVVRREFDVLFSDRPSIRHLCSRVHHSGGALRRCGVVVLTLLIVTACATTAQRTGMTSSAQAQTGSLLIDVYPLGESPDAKSADDEYAYVVEIDPPVAGRSLYQTASDGRIELDDVEPGDYLVRPALARDEWVVAGSVRSDQLTKITLATPGNARVYLYFNSAPERPVADPDFRKGLAHAIDVERVIAEAPPVDGRRFEVTRSFVPSWIDDTRLPGRVRSIGYHPDRARRLTRRHQVAVLTATTNDNNSFRRALLEHIAVEWEQLEAVETVEARERGFSSIVGQILDGSIGEDIMILSQGGSMSNRAHDVVQVFLEPGLLESVVPRVPDLAPVASSLEAAVEAGSIERYARAYAEANSVLMARLPIVPLATAFRTGR